MLNIFKSIPSTSVEYSNASPFSNANLYLLLVHQHGFLGLYDKDFNFLYELPAIINTSSRPRWSRRIESLLYFIEGRILNSYDVITGKISVIQAFPQYESIDPGGESDISPDGAHFVLCGESFDGSHSPFVFNIFNNEVTEFFPNILPFDGLKISSQNKIILSRASDPRNPKVDGIFVLDSPQITEYNGHAAPTNFNTLLWCSAADPVINSNSLMIIDLVNPTTKKSLKDFTWKESFHISTCDKDFCIISTDVPDNSIKSQILKVYYDSRAAELLYEFNNIYRNYESQLKASASRDGSLVAFCVDDGKTTYTDIIKLPSSQVLYSGFKEITSQVKKKYLIELNSDGTFREFESI